MKKKTLLLIISFVFLSCNRTSKVESRNSEKQTDSLSENKESHRNIGIEKIAELRTNYNEFKPDTISNLKIADFYIRTAHIMDELKIITGHFTNENIDFSSEEPIEDYGGARLLALNLENEIIYKSKGGGDIFLFEPHFYKNELNSKTIIICQEAFEYFCGGRAFLIENNKIKKIGTLDIESDEEETSLTDIIKITETNNQIIFEFNEDSLFVDPGGRKERKIKNNNTKYIYRENNLTFKE